MKLYLLFVFITFTSYAVDFNSTLYETENNPIRLITDPVLTFSAGGVGTMDNLSTTTSIVDSGTLSVTGISTLGTVNAASFSLSGNETITGTLSITGASTLGTINASSLSLSGNETVGGNLTVIGTLAPTNLDLVNSTAVAGNITKVGTRFITNFGTNNTFIGVAAGNFTLTTASATQNTALGSLALAGLTTGASNTAIGNNTAPGITSGSNNIALGQGALPTVNSGSNNIAIGISAGSLLTTGSGNIYIGATAATPAEATTIRIGNSQTRNFQLGIRGVTAANTDTAVVSIDSANQLGTGRIYNDIDLASTTATQGAILKNGTLWLHDSGTANTFLGLSAGNRTSSGNNNTGVGGSGANGPVFNKLNGGTFNTAIGISTLGNITAGASNTAVGSNALFSLGAAINQSQNTAVGSSSLAALQGGTGNIGIGFLAGNALTSGSSNIYLGNPGLVASESGIIRIGTGGGVHTTCFTAGNLVVENNVFVPGMTPGGISLAVEFTLPGGLLSYIPSSKKFKKNIEPLTDQAAQNFMQLQPVTFNFNHDTAQNPQTQYGFIAEDVNKIMPQLVIYDEQGEPLGLNFKSMYALLLKLIQNQQLIISSQTNEISLLNEKLEFLNSSVENYKNKSIQTQTIMDEYETLLSELQKTVTELLIRTIALESKQ